MGGRFWAKARGNGFLRTGDFLGGRVKLVSGRKLQRWLYWGGGRCFIEPYEWGVEKRCDHGFGVSVCRCFVHRSKSVGMV